MTDAERTAIKIAAYEANALNVLQKSIKEALEKRRPASQPTSANKLKGREAG